MDLEKARQLIPNFISSSSSKTPPALMSLEYEKEFVNIDVPAGFQMDQFLMHYYEGKIAIVFYPPPKPGIHNQLEMIFDYKRNMGVECV